MTPPRPAETDESSAEARATARWFQWAHDSIIELNHQYGPGVLTSNTTRGIFQRMQGRARANVGDNSKTCHLPTLDPSLFYFGYWYDAFNELHLWNTTRVEHDSKSWARFVNPYAANASFAYEAAAAYIGIQSDCLTFSEQSELDGIVVGPYGYPLVFFPVNTIPLGVGQYFDIPIISGHRNFGIMFGTFPTIPPTSGGTFVGPGGGLFYNNPGSNVSPGPLPF